MQCPGIIIRERRRLKIHESEVPACASARSQYFSNLVCHRFEGKRLLQEAPIDIEHALWPSPESEMTTCTYSPTGTMGVDRDIVAVQFYVRGLNHQFPAME